MAQPEGKSSLPCLVWGLTPEISTLEVLRGRLEVCGSLVTQQVTGNIGLRSIWATQETLS